MSAINLSAASFIIRFVDSSQTNKPNEDEKRMGLVYEMCIFKMASEEKGAIDLRVKKFRQVDGIKKKKMYEKFDKAS